MVNGVEGFGGYYLSAYGIAVKHGFHGTEEDWLEHLRAGEIELKSEDEKLFWKTDKENEWSELLGYHEMVAQLQAFQKSGAESLNQVQSAIDEMKESADDNFKVLKNRVDNCASAAEASVNAYINEVENKVEEICNQVQSDVKQQLQTAAEQVESAVEESEQKVAAAIGKIDALSEKEREIEEMQELAKSAAETINSMFTLSATPLIPGVDTLASGSIYICY